MPEDDEILRIVEVLLTAEIFNQNHNLDINDLPPVCREIFGLNGSPEIRRPFSVSEGMIRKVLGIGDARIKLKENPVVIFDEAGQRFRISALDAAARWFMNQGALPIVRRNPTLAFFFEQRGTEGVSYKSVRSSNPPFEDTKRFIEAKISKILAEDEKIRAGLDLIIVSAPEEIEQNLNDLVITQDQSNFIAKIKTGIHYREFLRRHRIHEVGKLLFVGPPGTGKTSLALAMAVEMHMPVLEVRLSMVTSQYLGETSKNIDRIFDFAKKMNPCILFIDEFDFVAKSRVADDHGAMKRAVNSLLKNIDQISLIRHGVILIGATNHPQLLDEAAWRRFDEIVPFSLPDLKMRKEILERVTVSLTCKCDFQALAGVTEGFSGADLRMVVKEATLSALMDGRAEITQEDIERGIKLVSDRTTIRNMNWL
ncbi:MAG: ATP-binding protein [Methanoregulaceae archaeon]|nr:ATP-binding protein [Methanoregulaceae archaeon]